MDCSNQNDESKDYSLCTMLKDFYNKKMLSIIIIIMADALIFIALAILVAQKFFDTENTKQLIMYAVIFLCCVHVIAMLKIFSWQMIHRNSIKRDIKRLESKIDALKSS